MKRKILALILAALTLNATIFAQVNRQLEQENLNKAKVEKRIALVIGNSAYTKAKALPNPANDAADVATALRDLGFEVLSGVNLNKRQTETLIREFGAKLAAGGGTGLFYYAGHGIQVGGENYLVPVDADIPEEDEVGYAAVPVSLVLTKMTTARNDLNIIILDACRNNPFARSWRTFRDNSSSDGLAKISPPTGTLVLYATEPGKVASDGIGRNGLFTEALLKQIKKPNVEYDQMVKALSTDVWQKSNKQQLPWKEGNSLQDFYFVRISNNIVANPIKPKQQISETEPLIVAKDKAMQEKEAWDLVKSSADIEDFRLFLKEFPEGENSQKAKIRLEELVWESARNSSDKSKLQAYLNEFPNGVNASSARIKLRQLEAAANAATQPTTNSTDVPVKRAYSLAEVLSVLRNQNNLPEEKNKRLIDGVKTRGIDFTATPEVEKTLIESGAGDQLISLIREKNPVSFALGTTRKNSIGMEFVWIPSGEFMMGSTESEISEALYEAKNANKVSAREWFSIELPKHKVKITNGFWMGKFEVTQKQWESVMGNNPSDYKDCGSGECPVEQVSWYDVQAFLKKLNANDSQYTYRLPTEAEWEYACRAGTTTTFAFGNTLSSKQARFDGRFPWSGAEKGDFTKKTAPVGSFPANAWGLYDMHGNVWEWVEDWYGPYTEGESTNPSGPQTGTFRVIRGGSWVNFAALLRSSQREGIKPDFREANGFANPLKRINIGFRIVAVPK